MNDDPSNAPTGSPGHCPKCGAALPADAPLGLCPACLLAAAAAPPPTHFQTTSPNRPEPPPLDVLQTAFPQLEIIELIGQGGMGVVYKARQPKLDRFVALKILPETLGKDPSFEERFTREARTLARLSHPNIVTIYDHGHAGAFFYLMMEFVDGVNLRQAMAAGKFTPAEALALVPHICEALQYAHEEGVLHRDIKPENILLDAKGRVKIADFGIAKMLGDAVPGSTLTASGAAMGTPQYMAPEQIEHPADVDHRADIFSLGVVFYEMLTGELPLGRFGPPSSKSAVDRRVDEIVFRTLEKERELRQQTAGEVKTQVEGLGPDANLRGAASGFAPKKRTPAGQDAPRVLKGQSALIFTPEILATFAGQMLGFRHRGQLLLDEVCLTVTKAGIPTVIPLSLIKDLSIGQFPLAVNPAGIDLLSLTYADDAGAEKQVFLAPMIGHIGFPATWNNVVMEWHMAITSAVVAVTGRAPSTTPRDQLGVPPSSPVILMLLLAGLATTIAFGLVAFVGSRLTGAELLFAALLVVFLVFVPCATLIAVRRRGRRQSKVGWVLAGVVGPFVLLPALMALVWMLRNANSRPPTNVPLSANYAPVPAAAPRIQPPAATVQKEVSPLAHLTNALRVPFSLPAKTAARFALLGPERVKLSIQSEWFPADQSPRLATVGDQELERPGKPSNLPFRSVFPADSFVPSVTDWSLSVAPVSSGFTATIVAPDTRSVDGILVWEPIQSGNGDSIYPTWRMWVIVEGLDPICSKPFPAPVDLPLRFAFPKNFSAKESPGNGIDLTPLDLSNEAQPKPSRFISYPAFAGPIRFDEWFPTMTNALDQAIAELVNEQGAETFGEFHGLIAQNNLVQLSISAPPTTLMPRWNYQMDMIRAFGTLEQTDYKARFPSYRVALGTWSPFRARPATEPGKDLMGIRWMEDTYPKLVAGAKEGLWLRTYMPQRPQAAYFPNDRVRIGLMTDEAEILAAIRSGSTNQVFGAVAQP
jgi:serine/threonine protein kinase